jgi:DNA polymerase I
VENLALFDDDLVPLAAASAVPAADVTAAMGSSPHGRHAASRRPTPSSTQGPLLLAVDGNSLAHRAFHAYGALGLGSAGGDRSGLYGFASLLAAVVDKVGADALVVGFDCRERSLRRERYAAYKATRPEKDPALYALLDLLPALLGDLGVEVVVAPGWEADDVVGSAAAAAEAAGWRCVVATSDRDAFALISDATSVLRLRSGLDNAVLLDPPRLRREVGVSPDQYVELAALRGDTSDNLPGVPGIGPARAAALLREYPTVAEAAADPIGCRSVLGRTAGQALLEDLADRGTSVFLRNVDLMTPQRDLPVQLGGCRPRRTAEAIAEVLTGWGLQSLGARLAVALAVRPEAVPLPDEAPLV